MKVVRVYGSLIACVLCIAACGDDDIPSTMGMSAQDAGGADASAQSGRADASATTDGGRDATVDGGVDIAALEAIGLTKYLGAAKPAETQMNGAETHYFFNESDGPVCLRGGRFAMGTRNTDSEDLVIYLQGGGSCRSSLCRATETANPMIPLYGVLNKDDPQNPVAGWNVVFSPYCDGSLHFGDSDIPDMNRKHHGLRNVSASLDVAAAEFPNPRRILLTGASAGGYGTIWMTTLVRLIYPNAELFVFNDAGMAISNPATPDGFRATLEEWGATQFIPEGCGDCRTGPHLTAWHTWNLQHHRRMKLALFSSYEDSVIAGTFLMIEPGVFKQALLDETAAVVGSAPDRAKRFLVQGSQHTVGNIHTTAVGGVSVAQWLAGMLDDGPWDNVLQ